MGKETLLLEIEKGQIGIDNLIQVQKLKASIIKEIWKILDKKALGKNPTFMVAFNFIDEAIWLGKIIGKHKEIAKEWEDLGVSELAQLDEVFKAELGIPDDKIVEFAAKINEFSHHLATFIEFLAKFKK
jgi:hypothetical protein